MKGVHTKGHDSLILEHYLILIIYYITYAKCSYSYSNSEQESLKEGIPR